MLSHVPRAPPRLDGVIHIPEELVATQTKYNGEAGRAFIAELPRRAAEFLDRWELKTTGPSMYGMASLVLPVERAADGTRAALKLQLNDEESAGEGPGLRTWAGNGIVRLLESDAATNTLLLERLNEQRHLSSLDDTREATRILAGLLARLVAVKAPSGLGLRSLADIAQGMLDDVPAALRSPLTAGPAGQTLRTCASAVRDVLGEPGDRLLHWDLHFDNVLAADREPWLAIDPKPLIGDPGFDLMPALFNELGDGDGAGDGHGDGHGDGDGDDFEPSEVLYRFDLLTETLGLDRRRAAAWTLGRALQNLLWNIEDEEEELDPVQLAIAELLRDRRLGP